ncbi:DUF116 domain-containing protein [Candidatus Bathyarchaeota archaeon]|nr:DUF116 domain-containing protein [Candidatus Bathyarchaeota archaeon]
MPYQFSFDLTKISRSLFADIARLANDMKMHRRIGEAARNLLERFRIHEITGLNVSDALTLIEDFIDIQIRNLTEREKFLKAGRRVLFLPHCSRKYMDNRCQAKFNPDIPSYVCAHCSPDCLINTATRLAEDRGYDVYILPGGSCIPKIMREGKYEAVVGVACGEEIKLAYSFLDKLKVPVMAVPLIKNGCAYTKFNIQTLEQVL